MDRDTRLRAFMEEYARAVAMVDDVAWIRQSLQRIELLIAIITAQLGAALLVAVLFFICNFLCCDGCGPSIYRGSNLQSSNVIERDGKQMRSSSKPELVA